eukprot:scaffold5664_cov115-Isochrysis_galbana.AAC.1
MLRRVGGSGSGVCGGVCDGVCTRWQCRANTRHVGCGKPGAGGAHRALRPVAAGVPGMRMGWRARFRASCKASLGRERGGMKRGPLVGGRGPAAWADSAGDVARGVCSSPVEGALCARYGMCARWMGSASGRPGAAPVPRADKPKSSYAQSNFFRALVVPKLQVVVMS